jgi:Tol biopolymer transport system component
MNKTIKIIFTILMTIGCEISTAQTQSYFCQEFSWSPDGNRIAFSARTEKEPFEIYVVNADGSGLKQITNDTTEDYWTSWSPDGKKIAFNSNRDGNYEIYVIDADGGNPVRLTNHAEKDIGPSFSPDGKKIAFTSVQDGNYELYVMKVDGTDLKRLTNTPHKEYNPIWSPNGKKLVYYYEKGDRKDQIYICNADGSRPKNITDNKANNIFPAWSADGKEIVFTSNLGSVEAIYTVKTNGTGLKAVKTGDERAFFARYSPDGSKLAVITGGWPSSTITILNADGTSPVRINLEREAESKPE